MFQIEHCHEERLQRKKHFRDIMSTHFLKDKTRFLKKEPNKDNFCFVDNNKNYLLMLDAA